MCGITGIVDPNLTREAIREILRRMVSTLVHRGPDEAGYFEDQGVGLGIRRLSIIDVAGGHQPIATEDEQVQVVCNGEIYNHGPLRKQLIERGHRFRTNSDVEVIAHLYEERGVECFEALYGMFGIAIWDARRNRLVLARDRLGQKPLFYHVRANRLLFGSEIKAILAAAPELAEPEPSALLPYLRFGCVPQPGTMYRDIRKLPAAHFAIFEQGELTLKPFWKVDFDIDETMSANQKNTIERLDELLVDAVRIRLQSEVPVGVFLSGGLDSSSLVAYAHHAGLSPLRTFTVSFDRPEWDESSDAQVVADHFGTDHHVLHLSEAYMVQHLPETLLSMVRHFDEPFGDAAALPTYHISQLARQHVTVILSGDGGDELFAGYTIYKGLKFADYYRRLPDWLGARLLPATANRLARWLPAAQRYRMQRMEQIFRVSCLPAELAYFRKSSRCNEDLLRELLCSDVAPPIEVADRVPFPPDVHNIWQSDQPTVNKLCQSQLALHLPEGYLTKVDRMSMAHALEVRSPMLDHRIVEFAAHLPVDAKLRGWTGKAILRDTVRSRLPHRTLRKRKQGFGVPLREWLRTGLSEMVGDYLESDRGGLPANLFQLDKVRRIVRAHRQGEMDYSSTIWLLLNYAAWCEVRLGQCKTISEETAHAY